jgi:hypothetical protein
MFEVLAEPVCQFVILQLVPSFSFHVSVIL